MKTSTIVIAIAIIGTAFADTNTEKAWKDYTAAECDAAGTFAPLVWTKAAADTFDCRTAVAMKAMWPANIKITELQCNGKGTTSGGLTSMKTF